MQWEFTAPYALNQDGVTERSIYTIISRAHTLLQAAPGLPKEFWAEAVNTAVYLTNRSSTKALSAGTTPHELFHSSKSYYRHLRTFGCAAYTLNLYARVVGKMAPRSEK